MTRTQRQIEQHRQGTAVVEAIDRAGRPWAGAPVWAEQEAHAFVFGCVGPEPDRERCAERLREVFNRITPAGQPAEPGAIRVDVPDGVDLGRFRRELDRLASAGARLEVWARGRAVGLEREDERAAAERVAELYTLCFAHPAVDAITWDGEGLLRPDGAPRPALRYLHKLIGTVWHSRASGETDADGRFRFRGFFGDYRVAARVGETAATTAVFAFRAEGSLFVLSLPEELPSRRRSEHGEEAQQGPGLP